MHYYRRNHGNSLFTDPGTADTHTLTVDCFFESFGGTPTAGAATVDQGADTYSGSCTYNAAGIYHIKVTITDDDGDSDDEVSGTIVVYDPSAGFVTGGGWINSPEGAYIEDPAATGKATFGFVSKYLKGASTPTGQTQFVFHAVQLNFHSDWYDWLVVSGARAQYKGYGSVNGVAGYGFMLTAIDGQVGGGGGMDKFRMKIWDSSGSIVYDSQMGDTGDTAVPNTALAGGSIIVHAKK